MNQTLPCCAKFALAISMAWLLVGCQSTPNSAPVVDRQVPVKAPSPTTATKTPRGMSAAQMGLENAGKPGYYTVKPSDTLVRIALDTGQNWKDLVRWNGLENPNIIEVGQVLRVAPPGVDPPVVAARPVSVAKVDTKPLDLKTVPVTAPLPTSPPGPVICASHRIGEWRRASSERAPSGCCSHTCGAGTGCSTPGGRFGDVDVACQRCGYHVVR
jgi:lipoprotein NlpD